MEKAKDGFKQRACVVARMLQTAHCAEFLGDLGREPTSLRHFWVNRVQSWVQFSASAQRQQSFGSFVALCWLHRMVKICLLKTPLCTPVFFSGFQVS